MSGYLFGKGSFEVRSVSHRISLSDLGGVLFFLQRTSQPKSCSRARPFTRYDGPHRVSCRATLHLAVSRPLSAKLCSSCAPGAAAALSATFFSRSQFKKKNHFAGTATISNGLRTPPLSVCCARCFAVPLAHLSEHGSATGREG